MKFKKVIIDGQEYYQKVSDEKENLREDFEENFEENFGEEIKQKTKNFNNNIQDFVNNILEQTSEIVEEATKPYKKKNEKAEKRSSKASRILNMLPYMDDEDIEELVEKILEDDELAKEMRAMEEAPNTPHKQAKLDELKKQKKAVQEELKRERSKRYPNRNKEVPYRAHLSGFKTLVAKVTTQQAMALTALGTFVHGKISVKGMRNINNSTGEVKPVILGTVKLQLVLNKEQAKQALVLQKSFKLSNAMNHK